VEEAASLARALPQTRSRPTNPLVAGARAVVALGAAAGLPETKMAASTALEQLGQVVQLQARAVAAKVAAV